MTDLSFTIYLIVHWPSFEKTRKFWPQKVVWPHPPNVYFLPDNCPILFMHELGNMDSTQGGHYVILHV